MKHKNQNSPTQLIALVFMLLSFASISQAQETTPTFTLRFSQIAFGAGVGTSEKYEIRDVIHIAQSSVDTQSGGPYELKNPLFPPIINANNGLASNQGTRLKLSWSADNLPAGAKGFNVLRAEGKIGDSLVFEQINSEIIAENSFEDLTVVPLQSYVYIIEVLFSDDTSAQWAGPFVQTFYDLNWMILGRDQVRTGIGENVMFDKNEDQAVDVKDLLYEPPPDD